jgi:hypothetical protein
MIHSLIHSFTEKSFTLNTVKYTYCWFTAAPGAEEGNVGDVAFFKPDDHGDVLLIKEKCGTWRQPKRHPIKHPVHLRTQFCYRSKDSMYGWASDFIGNKQTTEMSKIRHYYIWHLFTQWDADAWLAAQPTFNPSSNTNIEHSSERKGTDDSISLSDLAVLHQRGLSIDETGSLTIPGSWLRSNPYITYLLTMQAMAPMPMHPANSFLLELHMS